MELFKENPEFDCVLLQAVYSWSSMREPCLDDLVDHHMKVQQKRIARGAQLQRLGQNAALAILQDNRTAI